MPETKERAVALLDDLAALLADEDLDDEKLRAASEALLPRLHDAVRATLRDEDGARAILVVGGSLSRNLAVMQAAWIEWKHGRGAEAAMQWIENALWGPGLIPGEDGKLIVGAQQFYDEAIAEIEEHRKRAESRLTEVPHA